MTNRWYHLTMRSNNSDLEIIERLEVADLPAAVAEAKATLATMKATTGIPSDIRIKLLQFIGDVPPELTPP